MKSLNININNFLKEYIAYQEKIDSNFKKEKCLWIDIASTIESNITYYKIYWSFFPIPTNKVTIGYMEIGGVKVFISIPNLSHQKLITQLEKNGMIAEPIFEKIEGGDTLIIENKQIITSDTLIDVSNSRITNPSIWIIAICEHSDKYKIYKDIGAEVYEKIKIDDFTCFDD